MVLIGRAIGRRLPEHHRSAESRDAVKLAMGLVATMTALLLGLLVSSAKGTYDTQRTEIIQMSAKVTFLDRILEAYGPEASECRKLFHAAAEEAIRRIWPDEGSSTVDLTPNVSSSEAVYSAIQHLVPKNEVQSALKAQAASLALELGQLRMLLLAQMVPSIPKPLLVAVIVWLAIIFMAFSLLAPPNATATLSLVAAAASVAVAVFLIMELDQPLSGSIRLPSLPLRNALNLQTKVNP